MTTVPEKLQDREKLANAISQWNQDHYDLYELSPPNENLEFHGVVRFYFQDDDHNVVTKCIRVASSATTREVVEVLVEKFRPDMRMLTFNKYNLFEVHINGEERKLLDHERVLFVQLSWGKDVREGRFLLRREGAPVTPIHETPAEPTFKRKLSKREKKEKKKAEKERKMNKENLDNSGAVAKQLYTDAPETSFTRSISNPEAVMKRRRQQKLEKKLKQFHGQNGQGGTLKLYGETLKPDVPYKTLLLSTADTVKHVIKEAIEKYDLTTDDVTQFVLVENLSWVPQDDKETHDESEIQTTERILDDEECPLIIAMQHPPSRGTLTFHIKRKNADLIKPKTKRRAVSHDDLRLSPDANSAPSKLPFLVELNPDGTENMKGKIHRLHLDVTEVGAERPMSTSSQYLQLFGPNVQPRHCVIAHMSGVVTVTPKNPDFETYVDGQRVTQTTLLQHGMTVVFGISDAFRFFDPAWEEKQRKGHGQGPPEGMQRQNQQFSRPPETNFDMDGRVETVADSGRPPHPMRQDSRHSGFADDIPKSSPRDGTRGQDIPKMDDALPAALEFRDDRENEFLGGAILDVNASATQFKLSPTYTLYMAVRYRLSSVYRPDMTPTDRAHKLTSLVNKIADMVHQAIQDNRDNPATLAFWMANASEVLHFFKQDRDIHPFSQDAQEMLAEAVQMAFHHLVRCLQYDLQRTLTAFLDENDANDDEMDERGRFNRSKPSMLDVLDTLSSAMNLLRRCRVNAALTIQLFSQLFHFINMWLFNILVTEKLAQLCTRAWGMRLKRRLGRVEAWAEKQGLELAADCHLCRIIQAAHLLEAPKSSPDDIANITSTCFKLNSLQLRELLQRYIPEQMEPPIPQNLIDRVVSIAENMADDLIRSDGRAVQLEEDQDLQLPFLLPEDGYSCDTIKGVPNGLPEYVDSLARAGLCRMSIQPQSSGLWTVYMADDESSQIMDESIRERKDRTPEPRPPLNLPKEPEIITVTFSKVSGSMGLSIVAAKGDGQRERGIYIKSVVPAGAAAIDGRLQAGDQLLEVDGKSLVGLSQENAAKLMVQTGHTVTLKVAKQGAIYHGLATLLSQPSPVMQRASPQKNGPMTPGKQRPQDEGPPPYNGPQDNERMRPGMQKPESRTLPRDYVGPDKQRQGLRGPDSRSSPALNSGMSAAERLRVPSAGNLKDQSGAPYQPHQQQQHPHGHFNKRDNRDLDKAKSIPNLRMDTSYDGRMEPNMRPAQSVSALQRNPNHDYYNQPPLQEDSRNPDYENQPIDPRFRPQEPMRDNRPYQNASQVSPNTQHSKPFMNSQHAPPTSRTSQNFERPQSAYFGQQDRPEFTQQGRPKSDEISPEKLRDWNDMGQHSPHDNSFDNRTPPNYSNIRPQPNYANQGEIKKMDVGNMPKQPNFYENTLPRQQEPPPPFQQLRRPQMEMENKSGPPRVAPKPGVPPKPNQPIVQPAEIPRSDVDNRQTQPHFYNTRAQDRSSYPNTNTSQANPNSPQSHYQNTNFHEGRAGDPRSKISPVRDPYMQKGMNMSPPMNDMPPELPPPPSIDELHDEELPPLPPPPVTDYRIEQKLREEQNRMMQQMDPSYSNFPPQGFDYNRQQQQPVFHTNGPRDDQGRTLHSLPPSSTGYQPPYSAGYQQQGPQSLPPHSAGYQPPSHDYQNINYPNKASDRSFEQNQPSQQPQNVYETYDPRTQPPRAGNRPAIHKEIRDQREAIVSPWDREERERRAKQQEEDLTRIREMEIAELEARPHLAPHEQERLSKLRLEQEFQRRLQEVSSKDEDEESDTDERPTSLGRERLQSMQEELVKSRMRMQELEEKRLFDDLERERDRNQRLERKLEVFERDREEQRQRQQKRLEKQQREQEEYLRKQREAREKQRQQIEENIRLQKLEDEKMQQRKMEEMQRRKEMEKARLEEIKAAKEAEEKAAREQIRRQEEEYARQRMAEMERKRRDEEREIRVSEERKRLENMAARNQNQNQSSYQQYANLPPQPTAQMPADSRFAPNAYVPPPPERGSSYGVGNRPGVPRQEDQTDKFNGGYRINNPSPFRSSQENIPMKKSVSFNPQVNTHAQQPNSQPGFSHQEPQSPSYPSYQPPQSSYQAQSNPASSVSPSVSVNSFVRGDASSSLNSQDIQYRTQEATPTVIGSQEVYRDPRTRIEAKRATKGKQNADRLSFRDKMKFFAQEAGEGTPKEKPKASTTQRRIESQLHNGN